MAELSRRGAVAAMVVAGLTPPQALAASAQAGGRKDPQAMTIERFSTTPRNLKGVPRISYAVARGDMVYTAGVTASVAGAGDAPPHGDVKDQTRQVLAQIDRLLAQAGTDKSKLLTTQVWLTDMANFADHNDAWNEWVDPDNPPVRACLLSAQLWRPGMLVEIMVTAAR